MPQAHAYWNSGLLCLSCASIWQLFYDIDLNDSVFVLPVAQQSTDFWKLLSSIKPIRPAPPSLALLVQMKMTGLLALTAVPLNTLFGVVAAIQITRNSFWGKSVLISLLDLPFSISPVVAGTA